MNGISRRNWLKKIGLGGGVTLMSGGLLSPLSAEEIKKYNPRPLEGPIRLGSNENPYGPSEKMREAMINNFDLGCRYPWSYNSDLVKMIS
ncbi:MAG: aminotransferase, partial [Cyclobacteriaceae bacterium]|nr:aminotransferase [Cyclobacteriaceae bacterium]